MTSTARSNSPSGATPAAAQAGKAAVVAGRSLPAHVAIVTQEARPAGSDILPGPGAQAVTMAVSGAATGTITLFVAAELAEALQEGPLGASNLAAALEPALIDALSALETNFGAVLHAGVAEVVEAEAISSRAEAVAVPLMDGDDHVATLVLDLSSDIDIGHAISDRAVEFTPFVEAPAPVDQPRSLELLHDVEMAVTVELGRTRMAVRDLLSLAPGAVVELDRAAGSPVDVLVNGKLIARGEVVVIDEEFGIRISEIVGLRSGRA